MSPSLLKLAADMRAIGYPYRQIAAALRDSYEISPLAAMRYAHGWSQRDAARAWNELFPGEQKTFKYFSQWEGWPRAGYAPHLTTLERLAQLYQCAISDLLAGLGDYRHLDPQPTVPTVADELVPPATTIHPHNRTTDRAVLDQPTGIPPATPHAAATQPPAAWARVDKLHAYASKRLAEAKAALTDSELGSIRHYCAATVIREIGSVLTLITALRS